MPGRATVVGALLALAVFVPGAAAETDVDVDPTAPTVSFLDDRPITRTWTEITVAGGLAVTVRNEAAAAQKVTFDLLHLPPELPRSHAPPEFGARKARRVVVPLRSGAGQPKKEKYERVLVARGASGGVVRRLVTITVPATPVERGEALSPDDISDQTIPATNFVPSLANPYGPPVVVLALAGLVLLWLSRRKFDSRKKRAVGAVLVVAAAVAVVVAITGNAFDDRDNQNGWEAISTKSLPVIAGVADGTYGAATDDEADIAAILVRKQRLGAEGLDRAGAYKGKADLKPGEDGGDATVTFNVRDWWLFAFLVIALGVYIGYRVRLEFGKYLPRDKVLLARDRVIADNPPTVHESMPGYDIEDRVKTMSADIGRTARYDPVDAKKEVEALRTYLEAYSTLRASLRALRERFQTFRAIAESLKPPPPIEHVNKLDRARSLIGGKLESHTQAEFEALGTDIDDANTAIDELQNAHEDIAALREAAAKNNKLSVIKTELDALEREVFTSYPTDFDTKLAALRRKTEQPAPPQLDEVEHDDEKEKVAASTRRDAFADAQTTIDNRERNATWAAGALAVTSGLSVLYFADGVWGTPGDYLAALVWGAAASEGLKFVKALADKTWGD